MEQRRLIKFGTSSHVLSLPSSWLKKNKLEKGNLIYLQENNNGELVISSNASESELRKITIISDNKSFKRLSKEIFSAYINNYGVIVITGKNLDSIREEIRKMLHGFVALEIIEEDKDKIIAKGFLNIKDVSINENIRRMDVIIRLMMDEMKKSINSNVWDAIYKKDHDVNKFFHLLMRTLKGAIYDPGLMRDLGIKNENIFSYWITCENLEDIGDEVKRVSRFIVEGKLNDKEKNKLEIIFDDIEKLYLDAMKSYYKKDKELAFSVDSKKDELIEQCNKIFNRYHTPDTGRVLERIKKMIYGMAVISRVIYEN
ncbi:phosphate uptake regulator PhoU [Candidatus Woesearchaeota archaeon]|nr:phosphate uptake regulator PhoU [Candidatus Woesearchaeota archaeon]